MSYDVYLDGVSVGTTTLLSIIPQNLVINSTDGAHTLTFVNDSAGSISSITIFVYVIPQTTPQLAIGFSCSPPFNSYSEGGTYPLPVANGGFFSCQVPYVNSYIGSTGVFGELFVGTPGNAWPLDGGIEQLSPGSDPDYYIDYGSFATTSGAYFLGVWQSTSPFLQPTEAQFIQFFETGSAPPSSHWATLTWLWQ